MNSSHILFSLQSHCVNDVSLYLYDKLSGFLNNDCIGVIESYLEHENLPIVHPFTTNVMAQGGKIFARTPINNNIYQTLSWISKYRLPR